MAKFIIHGDLLTREVRALWGQGDYKTALRTLRETVPDMDRAQQMDLIEYRMKLVGENTLDFVEDTENAPSDYALFEDVMGVSQSARNIVDNKLFDDRQLGLYIVSWFNHYNEHYGGTEYPAYRSKGYESEPYKKIEQFNHLLPEVQKEFLEQLPFHMRIWMREYSKHNNSAFLKTYAHGNTNKNVRESLGGFGNMSSLSIVSAFLGDDKSVWTTKKGRDQYERFCDGLFIFGEEREDCYETISFLWRNNIETEKAIELRELPVKKIERTKASLRVMFAWVSPDGWFYPCNYTGHGNLAYRLLTEELNTETDHINTEMHLERLGWFKIHVSDQEQTKILYSGTCQPTALQKVRFAEHSKYHKTENPWEHFTY